MSEHVRQATAEDVQAMVVLSERERSEREKMRLPTWTVSAGVPSESSRPTLCEPLTPCKSAPHWWWRAMIRARSSL